MTFTLTEPQLAALKQNILRAEGDEEICGLICGIDVISLKNVSAYPRISFAMTVKDVTWAIDTFGELKAVWHSHPSGATHPSQDDIDNHPVGLPMIIVTKEGVTVHHAERQEAA